MEKINFESKVILAPLAGYTDRAFRELAISLGADMVYTEMISSTGLYRDDKKTRQLADISDYEVSKVPVGAQIFGHDPEIIKYAVEYLNKNEKISIIDLNLGCPAPKIVKNGDGSALLKNPDLIYKLLKTIRENTDKAVTCKMRLAIDGHYNYIDVAKAAETAKIDALVVHGRTREQMYSGQADWDKIQEIKDQVNTIVIGNGDIDSPELAKKRLKETDSIMIARGAIGKPWLFKQIKEYLQTGFYNEPSMEEKFSIIEAHLKSSVASKGERLGVLEMRKQIHAYLKGMPNSSKIKNQVNTITDLDQLLNSLADYRDYLLTLDI